MTTTHLTLADIPAAPRDDLTAKLELRSTRALQDLSRAMGKEYDTKLFDFSRDERTNSKTKLINFMRRVWYDEALASVMAKQDANGHDNGASHEETKQEVQEAASAYELPPRRVSGEWNVVAVPPPAERKIEYIKIVRNVGGWGLRQAKDIAEQGLRIYSCESELSARDAYKHMCARGCTPRLCYVDKAGRETLEYFGDDAEKANTPNLPPPVVPAATPSVPVPAQAQDVASQMAALFAQLTRSSVSPEMIAEQVKIAVAQALEKHTVSHRIVTPKLPPIDVGIQHKHFPKLLKMANARMRDGSRLNIWVHGPAGSGKTTAARNVAKALSLPFYFNGSIDQAYKLTGYCDAHGKYNTTAFRQAWEHGGVYLFDEIDGSSPTAFLELNAALANGMATFPDKAESVPRHKDCIIIAGANTIGLGGTIEYVGRMRLDAASLDRFVFLDWPIDEALERALCANVEWSAKVQASRGKLKSAAIKGAMISPRATMYGEALLAAGLSQDDVSASVLRKGMPDAEWSKVRL